MVLLYVFFHYKILNVSIEFSEHAVLKIYRDEPMTKKTRSKTNNKDKDNNNQTPFWALQIIAKKLCTRGLTQKKWFG